jgi:hypothetical protein
MKIKGLKPRSPFASLKVYVRFTNNEGQGKEKGFNTRE